MVRKRSLSNSSHSTYNESVCDEKQDTINDSQSAVIISEYNAATRTENIHDEEISTFRNIQVKNSTDIHFGNKTCYLGPVTIKQILCAHENENKKNIRLFDSVPNTSSSNNDNLGYIPDNNVRDIHLDKINNKIITAVVDEQHQRASVIKGVRRLQTFSQQYKMVFLSLPAVLLISVITLMVVFLTRNPHVNAEAPKLNSDSDEQDKGTPVQYPKDTSVNLTLPGKLKIISRKEWLAQPPVENINTLLLPIPYVVISHTATENCTDQATCTFYIRFLQTFHIESRSYWDIAYNFLVGGDGYAYEGRGWKHEGAHTFGYNSKSLGIAFVGTFNKVMPPYRQLLAAKQLIQKGVELGYVAQHYQLYGEKQLQDTLSPGLLLFEQIKTWPHWVNKEFRS